MKRARLRLKITALLVMLCMMLGACDRYAGSTASYDIDDNYRNFYEVFVYSFYDSNGDMVGDLKGVEEKLDYIDNLGCDGIYLMPIFQSPSYSKFDVSDYYSIDFQYGTMDDYASLVNKCHDKNMRVIMDLVINNTSSEHDWFREASDYLRSLDEGQKPDKNACKYVDYYNFSDRKIGSNWYKLANSNYFYEASYGPGLPDLRLASHSVKNELEQIVKFWMDNGIDGFRIDTPVHFAENDIEFNTGALNWLYNYCVEYNPDIYFITSVDKSEARIREYYSSDIQSIMDLSMSDNEGDYAMAAMGKETAQKFVTKMAANEKMFAAARSGYINAALLSDHDTSRVANMLRSDEDAIKYAYALLSTATGSTITYYGDEIGAKSKGNKDDNRKLPMYWSDKNKKGMCMVRVDADRDVEQTFGPVDSQYSSKESILTFYRRCMAVRHKYPQIARGDTVILDELTDGDIAVISRTWDDKTIYIVYNTGDSLIAMDLERISDVLDIDGIKVTETLCPSGDVATKTKDVINVPAQSVVYMVEK